MREAGDAEAQMPDPDFVEALEYGMPPACGFGMSKRVFAFFMDKSVRVPDLPAAPPAGHSPPAPNPYYPTPAGGRCRPPPAPGGGVTGTISADSTRLCS